MKGGIILPDKGYIQVSAYTSKAQIPLKDVAVSVVATDGTAIALRLTDQSGKIVPIEVPVPDLAESLAPNSDQIPFAQVNLYARLNNYEQIEIENLQIFANTITNQNLEMIPLAELPESWGQREIFPTPPQNL